MYKIERGKPFYYSLIFLVISGQIPKEFKKSTVKLFIGQNSLIKVLFIICNFIAPFLHLVMSSMGTDDVDISEDIAFSYGGFSALVVDFLFTAKWKQWSALLYDINKNREFGKGKDYDKLVERLNLISASYTLYCTGVVMVYGLNTFIMTAQCKQRNEEKNLHEICGTFISIWLPFEHVNATVTSAIFILQLLLFYFTAAPSAVMCVLLWEAVEILISHTNNLKKHFVEVFDVPASSEERRARLRFCVRYHDHILELGSRLSNVNKYSSGVVSILAVLALSCIGNQVFNAKPFGAIMYLIAYMAALFWVCYAGQRIKDETLSVKDAVYESKWYTADPKTMNDVKFIIARCQMPMCLETFPFGILDFPLYLLIIKTSYSYLTLFSQMT